MSGLYQELWGKRNSFTGFDECEVNIPQPKFYLDPPTSDTIGNEVSNFPFTGISEEVIIKTFLKLETTCPIISDTTKLLVREEYIVIENMLHAAEINKWSTTRFASYSDVGAHLDYRICGQPGAGKSAPLSSFCLQLILIAFRKIVFSRLLASEKIVSRSSNVLQVKR